MNLQTYIDLTEAINDALKKGFTNTFIIENNGLRCLQDDKFYPPSSLTIEKYHRFRGDKNRPEDRIIFLINTNTGHNGYIVSGGNVKSNMQLLQIMDRVKVVRREFFQN